MACRALRASCSALATDRRIAGIGRAGGQNRRPLGDGARYPQGGARPLLKVAENIDRLRFNAAVAEIRDLANTLVDAVGAVEAGDRRDLRFAFREAAIFWFPCSRR